MDHAEAVDTATRAALVVAWRFGRARPDLADEFEAEAYLSAAKALADPSRREARPAEWGAWCAGRARRDCIQFRRRWDHYRSRRRAVQLAADAGGSALDPGPQPGAELAEREAFERRIRDLPETARRVLALRYRAGCGHAEVGAALGITHDCSRQHLARALRRLREDAL